MSNKLLSALFGAGFAMLALSPAVHASDVLADVHAEAGGCESCHADGEPSADLAHENGTCVDCHGGMADMDEPHPTHEDVVNCTDCHEMHEHTADTKPELDASDEKCADCHG
ncbi:cytochrome c3 family protein [Paraferrimonas sedimenticola]|uniref:Cytochrome c n=1 Tax=Paraferrimonas sedimenticola TaxID=375674 RepID=A0AA37W0W4_9GAMM|nr:cytochrome c3 family protein [Paraferrimonas sedimenticola]GLP96655.1 cytochrome c [Paraferrimonas sedimenticola]